MGKTWREKYVDKYGEQAIGGVAKIANTTGIPRSILQQVYNRGVCAWKTNIDSVRLKSTGKKNVRAPRSAKMSKEQWAMARVYGFVMKNPRQVGKAKPDRDLLDKYKASKKNKA